MGPIDQKRLNTAIVYLQRIVDGKNPVNNMPAGEDTVLNNTNVVRCMEFVKEVLEEVRANDGFIGAKPKKGDEGKAEFPLEILENFSYREDQGITRFVGQLNELIDENVYRKLSYRPITQWLKEQGYLKDELHQETGKNRIVPTEKGAQIGIWSERKKSFNGPEYLAVVYGKQAQEFIVGKMREILENNA